MSDLHLLVAQSAPETSPVAVLTTRDALLDALRRVVLAMDPDEMWRTPETPRDELTALLWFFDAEDDRDVFVTYDGTTPYAFTGDRSEAVLTVAPVKLDQMLDLWSGTPILDGERA